MSAANACDWVTAGRTRCASSSRSAFSSASKGAAERAASAASIIASQRSASCDVSRSASPAGNADPLAAAAADTAAPLGPSPSPPSASVKDSTRLCRRPTDAHAVADVTMPSDDRCRRPSGDGPPDARCDASSATEPSRAVRSRAPPDAPSGDRASSGDSSDRVWRWFSSSTALLARTRTRPKCLASTRRWLRSRCAGSAHSAQCTRSAMNCTTKASMPPSSAAGSFSTAATHARRIPPSARTRALAWSGVPVATRRTRRPNEYVRRSISSMSTSSAPGSESPDSCRCSCACVSPEAGCTLAGG
mmetsp:Transcript_11409/g.33791  ORF Transcript_11409/g.33791 Transcript_11409/m.33791 type:complete len:304 (-) Transcript_11409:180-1091(-)